jgi:very-short-patch-repair endonuclease
VIPPYIADFVCPSARLIIEVDGDTHDELTDARRDATLATLGYRVLSAVEAQKLLGISLEGSVG